MTGSDASPPRRRFCIIHGHFYQPPRENPWLGIIERQSSAAPYANWNERVYDECYRPNASSRLLDSRGMIRGIHNNFRHLSFNIGPTLLDWIEKNHPRLAARIVEADGESRERLGGHGNALAQGFNHVIMPLASPRDQRTQVRWAAAHFRSRFQREPEGMWLPEAAINRTTIEVLIDEGIRFVVLSPRQAAGWRCLEGHHGWVDADRTGVDPRRAYRIFSRSDAGRRRESYLDVFFFDEGLSREVSFGGLLVDSRILANRIAAGYDGSHEGQAVVIATDGETFGHHKPLTDMCLSYFFREVAEASGIAVVNFGWFLQHHPPRHEVSLKGEDGEGSAWSCAHGTGRWSRDCGCSVSQKPGWNQAWRGPLRAALEGVQRTVDAAFEREAGRVVADPWALRDAVAPLGAEGGALGALEDLLASHGARLPVDRADILRVRRLLEAQKYMQFAFTSCGWFFDDIGGLEALQNLACAARAIQLGLDAAEAREAALASLLAALEKARGNLPHTNGRALFESKVLPWLRSAEILAFAIGCEKALLKVRHQHLLRFGYSLRVRDLLHKRGARHQHDAFLVDVFNENTGEAGGFAVFLSHSAGLNVQGRVLPSAVAASADPRDVASARWWASRDGVVSLGLSDLFETSRQQLFEHYRREVARDLLPVGLEWVERRGELLAAMAALGGGVGPALEPLVRLALGSQWDRVVNRLRGGADAHVVHGRLLDIWNRARRLGVTLDLAHCAAVLEQLLQEEMAAFARTLEGVSCDRMRGLLTIVDSFGVPVAKSRLEDAFFEVYSGPLRQLHASYRSGGGRRTRSLLITILAFARRMNFNTDGFRLDACCGKTRAAAIPHPASLRDTI